MTAAFARLAAAVDGRRVAVVHEWIAAYTGSEQVFEAIAMLLPDADLYALTARPGVALQTGERPITTTLLDTDWLRERRGITLPLMPLVASFGVAVPQLSGRGLGHTGGTLDKLEWIPGWRADLSNDEIFAQLRDVGGVICAAGGGLAPADKKLYALRDITGTVEAIPLIASSIMSKKIAEGTGSLVLDVKVGTGAFMKDVDKARELAQTMVGLGTDAGVHTVALLTDMSTPLGLTAGNAVEVAESVEVLAGHGVRAWAAGEVRRDDVDGGRVLLTGQHPGW